MYIGMYTHMAYGSKRTVLDVVPRVLPTFSFNIIGAFIGRTAELQGSTSLPLPYAQDYKCLPSQIP